VGWPPRLVPWPPTGSDLEAAELEAIIRSALADPFAVKADVLGRRGGSGHLCATAWVLDAKRARTLLVRHRNLGWSVPGGHLEPGEPPAAGALRELLEETGVVGRLLRPQPCFVHTSEAGGPRPHRHWNLAYAIEADPAASLVIERDQVAWFSLDSVPSEGPADLAPGLAAVVALADAT